MPIIYRHERPGNCKSSRPATAAGRAGIILHTGRSYKDDESSFEEILGLCGGRCLDICLALRERTGCERKALQKLVGGEGEVEVDGV